MQATEKTGSSKCPFDYGNISLKGIIVAYAVALSLGIFVATVLQSVLAEVVDDKSVFVVTGLFLTIIGGVIVARIGSKAPYANTALFIVIGVVLSFAFEKNIKTWFFAADIISTILGSILGAFIATSKNERAVFASELILKHTPPTLIGTFVLCVKSLCFSFGFAFIMGLVHGLLGYPSQQDLKEITPQGNLLQLSDNCPRQPSRFIGSLFPLLSDEKIVRWASSAPLTVLDLNRIGFKDDLLKRKGLFTPTGWCAFIAALSDVQLEKLVIDQKISLSLQARERTKIVEKREAFGTHLWKTETPVTLLLRPEATYTASEKSIEGTLAVEILQISPGQSFDEMAISHFSFTPSSPLETMGDKK